MKEEFWKEGSTYILRKQKKREKKSREEQRREERKRKGK